uniref:Uncharacterized protein n=1 Tax=Myoviridae sp. ct9dX1 TaxID=2827665 RepID=A0A8S5TIL1_9CAUD|nr:MAG TPA: hypothetical protein [Myoviridae sp. ct9dX1]
MTYKKPERIHSFVVRPAFLLFIKFYTIILPRCKR